LIDNIVLQKEYEKRRVIAVFGNSNVFYIIFM